MRLQTKPDKQDQTNETRNKTQQIKTHGNYKRNKFEQQVVKHYKNNTKHTSLLAFNATILGK